MTKYFLLLILLYFNSVARLNAQQLVKQADGGGGIDLKSTWPDELTSEQRTAIIAVLKNNEARLRREGKLTGIQEVAPVNLSWPLQQAPGFFDNNVYGITNYVDEDPLYPGKLLDYNCGTRTYDLADGYNHRGTDIATWPFPWQKMQQNSVQVVAGASGTILAKSDNNFDQNCSFCSPACFWNAIYIIHPDGSVAWYGHLKSGSLTTKAVGQPVSLGEYLGVVGSSGNSTGPHLHLELYTNTTFTKLVDPWAGACNAQNGNTSWWTNQQPYFQPTLNTIMTHGAAPGISNCPAGESTNEQLNFVNGQVIYLAGYYRDVQNGSQSIHTIYKPDNSVLNSWTQTFNTYYPLSWWYYFITLPDPAPSGTWRYEIGFNGKKYHSFFAVNVADMIVCPGGNAVITSNKTGSNFQWQVNMGSGYQNLSDNNYYNGVNTGKLELKKVPSSFYGYQFRCLVDGAASNVIGTRFLTRWNGNESKEWENPLNWTCGVPDSNTDADIPAGVNNYPEISSNAICRSTHVKPGATIKVNPGWHLNITGN